MNNLALAPNWIRDTATQNGIRTGKYEIVNTPSHNTDGVFTPGKVRVFNTRKSAEFTFGTDIKDHTITDENVWEHTR
jgi:hypothetical protein